MKATLYHLGNVVIDIVSQVPHLPVRGGDLIAQDGLTVPGGAFNVMAAATRQGLPTVYAGLLGSGPFGTLAEDGLIREGISWVNPRLPNADTGFVICLIDPEGERTFVTNLGAEATLLPRHLGAISPRLGDILYISGYSLVLAPNRDTIIGWLKTIAPDIIRVFDPGPLVGDIPDDILCQILHQSHWVTLNRREAALLTGADLIESQANQLIKRTPAGQVVIRDGANGCALAQRNTPLVLVPGFSVPVLDTNGAGDTHAGTFLARLALGDPPTRAARWANAAAAISTTHLGPATAPTQRDVMQWLASTADS